MNNEIVDPVPGVFTFIGDDGNGLKDIAMQLNEEWGMYMVRRVGDDSQLNGLEKTLETVKEGGVDRSTMVNVESMNLGPLNENYPANSYTIKRSRTNQKIALEEIRDRLKESLIKAWEFIINALKRGLAHLSTLVASARQKMKWSKSKDLKEKAEKEGYFKQGRFLPTDQIKRDPKLSADAEAISDNYSELLNTLLVKGSFRNAFQNIVEDSPEIAKGILTKAEVLEQALSKVGQGASADLSVLLSKVTATPLPGVFITFGQYLGSNDTSSLEDGNNILYSLNTSRGDIDPYNFTSLVGLFELAVNLIGGKKPLFVFDDDGLEAYVLKTIKLVNELEQTVKRIGSSDIDLDEHLKKEIKNKLAIVVKDNKSLVFVVSHAEQFYDSLYRFTKAVGLYLEHCKVSEE